MSQKRPGAQAQFMQGLLYAEAWAPNTTWRELLTPAWQALLLLVSTTPPMHHRCTARGHPRLQCMLTGVFLESSLGPHWAA